MTLHINSVLDTQYNFPVYAFLLEKKGLMYFIKKNTQKL